MGASAPRRVRPGAWPLVLAALLAAAPRPAAPHCTTILAGKRATADGSMIIARTADAGDAVRPAGLLRHAAPNAARTFRSNANGFEATLPQDALGYTASPAFASLGPGSKNPSFECCGANAMGVSMSATETIVNSDAALRADPLNEKDGVCEDAIVSVILPVARSAREGAERLGALVSERGTAEGFGVSFMDKDEIWYFETASGHRWLAQRVPHDTYFVAANQGRFTSIPKDALASPDLEAFAFSNGLCDSSRPFSFFDCYMKNEPEDISFYNHPRVARLQELYSNNPGPDYPVFAEPSKKLDHWDVISGLRDHYQGTPAEPYFNRNPSGPWRPISLLRTQVTHVSVQRPAGGGLPQELRTVEWMAWGMPTLSPFLPLYLRALQRVPDRLAAPTDKPDATSLYWIMRRLQAVVFQDFPSLAPEAIKVISRLERETAQAAAAMEKRYTAGLASEDTPTAAAAVQRFTDAAVERCAATISRLTRRLEAKAGLGPLSDEQYVDMLVKAEQLYHFHLPEAAPPGAVTGAADGADADASGAPAPGAGGAARARRKGGEAEGAQEARPRPS